MSETIYPRLAEIKSLDKGVHQNIHEGSCIMEAASYVAGEPWSDNPNCVCPVITAFLRNWNDTLFDEERNLVLLPLLPLLLNTRANAEVEKRRAYMALNWLVKAQTITYLRLAGLTEQVNILRYSLPGIRDYAQFSGLIPILEAVEKDIAASLGAVLGEIGGIVKGATQGIAVGVVFNAVETAIKNARLNAAGDAAWVAAVSVFGKTPPVAIRATALHAIRVATMFAAREAIKDAVRGVIEDASRGVDWAKFWDVTRIEVGRAIRSKLQPTKHKLHKSALQLVHRMINVKV